MRVLYVDSERTTLQAIQRYVNSQPDVFSVAGFEDPLSALAFAKANRVDVAFLDIQMQPIDGLALAERLQAIHPNCAVIFVTSHPEHAVAAFALRATGYLIKPVTDEALRHELDHVMHPLTAPRNATRIRIQCFGNFEAFCGDAPLQFERSKTKELLAYLVDRRGSAVNTGELCAVLWENRDDSNSLRTQLRTLYFDLTRTLRAAGAEDILRKSRNSFAIDVDKVECDYYGFLRLEAEAVNQYRGEYMSQYSWAEVTLGRLESN